MDNTENVAQAMPIEEKDYVIAICDEYDAPYLTGALHIERNDSKIPPVYITDEEAARVAEQDGVRLIYGMDGVEEGIYLDTPENRETIKSFLEFLKQDKNNEKSVDEQDHSYPTPPEKMPIKQQLEMYGRMASAHAAADRPVPERAER